MFSEAAPAYIRLLPHKIKIRDCEWPCHGGWNHSSTISYSQH